MTTITGKYLNDYLLVDTHLTNNEINTNTFEATRRLQDLIDPLPSHSLHRKKIKKLCLMVDRCITAAALNCGLYLRELKPLAVISGAGISGLAAAFELRAKGFNVVIAEKRKDFSRFNIINLGVETQLFLKKFNLLEKFENLFAPRIKEHRYLLIEKNKSFKQLQHSDVTQLQLDESIPFVPENFNNLFEKDGIYSVPIGILQNFLAEHALEAGVNILGDAPVRIISLAEGIVSKIKITADLTLQPALLFIAEGAHPTTTHQLGMETNEVKNACTGEKWIFGNMSYPGKETFVISLIDTSEKTLRIANVIFNAKSHVINVAVTSDADANEASIKNQILKTINQVLEQQAFPLEKMDCQLLTTVAKPVDVSNRTSSPYSKGNAFCIGDSAGSSSPLAGLGGTLGLTLIPRTVSQLLDDYEKDPENINKNFNTFSEAYTKRWINKSEGVKAFCIGLFNEQNGLT